MQLKPPTVGWWSRRDSPSSSSKSKMEQSLHIGSFLDPLLTYLLGSLPSILTLRYILYIYSMYLFLCWNNHMSPNLLNIHTGKNESQSLQHGTRPRFLFFKNKLPQCDVILLYGVLQGGPPSYKWSDMGPL